MNCESIRKGNIADEYLAGRLSSEETEAYERHYFDCEACFADLQFRRGLAEQLKAEGAEIFAAEIAAEQEGAGVPRLAGLLEFQLLLCVEEIGAIEHYDRQGDE